MTDVAVGLGLLVLDLGLMLLPTLTLRSDEPLLD